MAHKLSLWLDFPFDMHIAFHKSFPHEFLADSENYDRTRVQEIFSMF